jgi:hypothetical protein
MNIQHDGPKNGDYASYVEALVRRTEIAQRAPQKVASATLPAKQANNTPQAKRRAQAPTGSQAEATARAVLNAAKTQSKPSDEALLRGVKQFGGALLALALIAWVFTRGDWSDGIFWLLVASFFVVPLLRGKFKNKD